MGSGAGDGTHGLDEQQNRNPLGSGVALATSARCLLKTTLDRLEEMKVLRGS
jgi:hypothetical protein